jgi:hypothetical protein
MRSPDEARVIRSALKRGAWWLAAMLLAVGGCEKLSAPLGQPDSASPQFSSGGTVQPVLAQSSSAPPLETYQISFWGYQSKATSVTVNYLPAAGDTVGQPFLRFDIPKASLLAGAGGTPLIKGDSVWITLTIDSLYFNVDFQPSGVKFSIKSPATMALWYRNANQDLNGNGVVDGYDQKLLSQLAIYYILSGAGSKLPSVNDTTQEFVAAPLLHFSQYAVSW